MNFFNLFGDPNKKYLEKLQPTINKINNLESEFQDFSIEKLKEKTNEFKERLKSDETLDNILSEAFALVREAGKRTLNQRHFDVQLIGGIALHQGKITEMVTGEGKTLCATLPAYLNSLEGKGVHIITVNDYLTKRDMVWMGQIYYVLGLSVGCIVHEKAYLYDPEYQEEDQEDEKRDLLGSFKVVESYLRPVTRKEAYLADIVYGTNNEFGFDYLRDNMALDSENLVQRGYNYAIIDEVDSILIDESRTPLIISQPDIESSNWYKDFARIIPRLEEDADYNIDEKFKAATLTENGIDKIEKILGVENIYQDKGIKYLHYLEQALKARVFFLKDKNYIVKDDKVIIVDEFTGRLMPGRRYSGGLHQAIEAKEGVEVQPESKTLASITFQNYFRLYNKLAGMTGTAMTSAEEFDKVYEIDTIVVPTNKPMQRENLSDCVYKTEKGKFMAIVNEVKSRHEKGQPVLIGTTSIEKNEYLGKLLDRDGVPCQILNAKHHEREGEIIAQAGRLGAVTVATNMAGRGVDIILGGNPSTSEETQKVKELGGLHVIGTERHEARRIDNQLRGRAGRQGDPGSSQFFVSLEDDLMRVFGGDRIKSIMEMLKIPEDQPIEAKILSNNIEKAQEKIEGMNFDLRKHILDYDDVISKHRNRIYTERKQILEKDFKELKIFVQDIIKKEIEKIVIFHTKPDEESFMFKEIIEEIKTVFPIPAQIYTEITRIKDQTELIDYLFSLSKIAFAKKEETEGIESIEKVLRFVCIRTINLLWSEHLDTMESLKGSVRLRAYGGKDPLIEYKTEGNKLFRQFQSTLNSQISRTVFKLSIKA
jgi:preprotein translocase subunit SecA